MNKTQRTGMSKAPFDQWMHRDTGVTQQGNTENSGPTTEDEKTTPIDPGPGTRNQEKQPEIKAQKNDIVPQKPITRKSREPEAKPQKNAKITIEPDPKSPTRINIPQRSRPCIACRVNIITKDGSKRKCKNKVYCRSYTQFQSKKYREAIKSQGMCRQHVVKTFKPLLKYHKTQPDTQGGESKYNPQKATQLHTTLKEYNLLPYTIDPETLWYVLSAVRSLTETNRVTCAIKSCRNPVFKAKRCSKLKPQNQQYHQQQNFNDKKYCYQHFINKPAP